MMVFITIFAFAQYNERGKFVVESLRSELQNQQNMEQLKSELGYSEKWEEWKTAQNKIAQGKAFLYTGIAVGAITSGVCLSMISNNRKEMMNPTKGRTIVENNIAYRYKTWEDGSMMKISYDSINKHISAVMWTLDAISIAAALYGLYIRGQGRSELDKIYSRVYFNGRGFAVNF
jgi:hypothetical protein